MKILKLNAIIYFFETSIKHKACKAWPAMFKCQHTIRHLEISPVMAADEPDSDEHTDVLTEKHMKHHPKNMGYHFKKWWYIPSCKGVNKRLKFLG